MSQQVVHDTARRLAAQRHRRLRQAADFLHKSVLPYVVAELAAIVDQEQIGRGTCRAALSGETARHPDWRTRPARRTCRPARCRSVAASASSAALSTSAFWVRTSGVRRMSGLIAGATWSSATMMPPRC